MGSYNHDLAKMQKAVSKEQTLSIRYPLGKEVYDEEIEIF